MSLMSQHVLGLGGDSPSLTHLAAGAPQGDGMAQLICRGTEQQQAVCDILEKELSVHCTKLTLQQSVTSQSPDGCEARHHQLSAGHSRRS